MKDCPCRECADRTATCHADCGRYREWKQESDERRTVRNNERRKARQITEGVKRSMNAMAKRGR